MCSQGPHEAQGRKSTIPRIEISIDGQVGNLLHLVPLLILDGTDGSDKSMHGDKVRYAGMVTMLTHVSGVRRLCLNYSMEMFRWSRRWTKHLYKDNVLVLYICHSHSSFFFYQGPISFLQATALLSTLN